jgi:hypothetical protein
MPLSPPILATTSLTAAPANSRGANTYSAYLDLVTNGINLRRIRQYTVRLDRLTDGRRRVWKLSLSLVQFIPISINTTEGTSPVATRPDHNAFAVPHGTGEREPYLQSRTIQEPRVRDVGTWNRRAASDGPGWVGAPKAPRASPRRHVLHTSPLYKGPPPSLPDPDASLSPILVLSAPSRLSC